MGKYFKTVFIDAIQYTGYNIDEVRAFSNNDLKKHEIYSDMVSTAGETLHVGGYVIKDGDTFKIMRNIDFEREYKKL